MNNIEAKLKIYSEKLNLANSYVNRSWQRFNWFITLSLGFFSFLLTNYEKLKNFILLYISIGLIFSCVWFLMGFEDYKSIREYFSKIKLLEERILEKVDDVYLKQKSTRKFEIRQTIWLFILPLFFVFLWIILLIIFLKK